MRITLCLLVSVISLSLSGQSVVGVWKTVDDVDGLDKSHLELKEVDGKLQGKIIKLLDSAEGDKCLECEGDKKNAPLVGMEIIWNMKNKNGTYDGGKILDPKTGKVYKCKIALGDDPDELKVRGYIGFSLMGRTQTWYRVDN